MTRMRLIIKEYMEAMRALPPVQGDAMSNKAPPTPAVPAGFYVHHKGGFYSVLMVAEESTNSRTGQVVVYVSMTTGKIHTRDLLEFVGSVRWPDGWVGPRFRRCQHPEVGEKCQDCGTYGCCRGAP